MSEKLLNVAKKLKALAERGVGGEKVNAEKMLSEMMLKHGITLEMLDEEVVRECTFKVSPSLKQLFVNVVAQVINRKRKWDVYWMKQKPGLLIVSLTFAEEIEVRALFGFYADAFKQEIPILVRAFIQANRIFPDAPEEDDSDESNGLTEEDLRVLQMAGGIKKRRFQKQLGQ